MVTPLCFMDNPHNFIGKHRTLSVLSNGFPISSLHLLLATAEHRGELREEDIHSALDFALAFPDYLVFHNMQGSGATRPEHVHFQVVLHDEALPIKTAPRREVFSLGESAVTRVEDYPIYSLAVRGEQAAEITFTILQELSPTPFNLVLIQEEIIIIPRTVEQPSGFASKFGGLEMAGCVVVAGSL
jgi:ATP adenylyltransferase/5',5'''-P-1,P-4-tetraphosphate phosphorylase II